MSGRGLAARAPGSSGKEMPLVIAFYTRDTGYVAEVARLRKSVETLGLEHDIRGIPDQGSWESATHFKATFIQWMRSYHPGRALLYVDADAAIKRVPEFLRGFNAADVALRVQDFPYRKGEWLSGTLCIGPTPAADEMIRRWIAYNDAVPAQRGRPETYEQANLRRAVESLGRDIRMVVLPLEYCFIFDTMRRMYPGAVPVIEHFQASRRLAKPGGRKG